MRGEACLLEDVDGFLEAPAEFGHLPAPGRLAGVGLRRLHPGELAEKRVVHVAMTPPADQQLEQPQEPDCGDHAPADPLRPQRLRPGVADRDRQQGADIPDQQ